MRLINTKIECDNCKKDLLKSERDETNRPIYRIVLSSERIVQPNMWPWPDPPIGEHHFCNEQCLSEWLQRRKLA